MENKKEKQPLTASQMAFGTVMYVLSQFLGSAIDVSLSIVNSLVMSSLLYFSFRSLGLDSLTYGMFLATVTFVVFISKQR